MITCGSLGMDSMLPLCPYIPCKFPGQKWRPTEIQHDFFLITSGFIFYFCVFFGQNNPASPIDKWLTAMCLSSSEIPLLGLYWWEGRWGGGPHSIFSKPLEIPYPQLPLFACFGLDLFWNSIVCVSMEDWNCTINL